MPVNDTYNEVLLGVITGIIILLVVASVVVFNLLHYQKRRFQHLKKLSEMEKRFSDELLQSQLEIQELTFNQISEEIHDNVGQLLSLAKVQVNIIDQRGTAGNNLLADVKDTIGKAMADLRDLSKGLNSTRIATLGIHTVVAQEIERINRTNLFKIELIIIGDPKELDQRKKLILYRIIQESLQNIIKHAKATQVMIHIKYGSHVLTTIIKDNGLGFDPDNKMHSDSGLGLTNMHARAALAGGKTTVDSTQGSGTTVTIDMPYK